MRSHGEWPVEQLDLLRYVIDVLDHLQVQHMIVGSMASSSYGEARLTHDIDIVLELPPTKIREFCRAFPDSEYYYSESAIRDAVRTRFQFNILHPKSGNKIDFMFPSNDAWGAGQLQRRQRIQLLPGREGNVASPEDVIIAKLRYYAEGGSEKHLRDIAGILRVRGNQVDRPEIEKWAKLLGLDEVWNAAVRRADDASEST